MAASAGKEAERLTPHIVVLDAQADFDRAAADWVCERMQRKPGTVLGLATGSSPVGLYRELVRRYREGRISFRGVRTFNLDEYVGLPPGHPQSYTRFMAEHLFDHVDIDRSRAHLPRGDCADPQAEALRYEALLAEYGPIDAQVLGIGTNGHIGFNEPGTPFSARTHVVELTEETRTSNARFFASPDEVPRRAITMGIANILESREILLLARGPRKVEALRRSFCEPPTPDVPGSALQHHPRVTLLLDRAAAQGLDAVPAGR